MNDLIRLSEIEQQPALWRTLLAKGCNTLEGLPLWQSPPWVVGVAEGSSFNALRLGLQPWAHWLPGLQTTVFRPWELEEALNDPQAPLAQSLESEADAVFWLPVSQSGKTQSLLLAWQGLKTKLPPQHPVNGLLLSNFNLENPAPTLCQHTWHLGAGPETAIAATKTMTGSLLALWLLGLWQARQANAISEETVANHLKAYHQAADALESWLAQGPEALEAQLKPVGIGIAGSCQFHPALVLISRGPLVWMLAEAALKLTETTRQPVLYHHSENFKHGPKAMLSGSPLHPKPPCVLYLVPTDALEAERLFNDVRVHFSEFEGEKAEHLQPKRLWMRFENSPALPKAWQAEPCLTLPAVHHPHEAILIALCGFQLLGLEVATALGLDAQGLQKAVE